MTDADGDTAQDTVRLETLGVQVGNENGQTITGGSGSDIIIGDRGYTPESVTGVTYNISLVLDTSASMSQTGLTMARLACSFGGGIEKSGGFSGRSK